MLNTRQEPVRTWCCEPPGSVALVVGVTARGGTAARQDGRMARGGFAGIHLSELEGPGE